MITCTYKFTYAHTYTQKKYESPYNREEQPVNGRDTFSL